MKPSLHRVSRQAIFPKPNPEIVQEAKKDMVLQDLIAKLKASQKRLSSEPILAGQPKTKNDQEAELHRLLKNLRASSKSLPKLELRQLWEGRETLNCEIALPVSPAKGASS